ncbi:hypothetical protein ACFWTE_18960 [Nocardiopsis sp. NPDC058631]|uniref:hypothetical protein n=1 Tax=Nocardiopsis sp. NPDC058631 TaxID=3346566 RepID=UPI003657D415
MVLGARRDLVGGAQTSHEGDSVDQFEPGDPVSRPAPDTTLLRGAVTNGLVTIAPSGVPWTDPT